MIWSILAFTAFQASGICQDAATTADISRCVATVYSRADERMTAQWRSALARMKTFDRDSIERKLAGIGYAEALLDSQRKWLAFRDSQCRIESYQTRGGSGQGYSEGLCRIRLTEERTRVLSELEF